MMTRFSRMLSVRPALTLVMAVSVMTSALACSSEPPEVSTAEVVPDPAVKPAPAPAATPNPLPTPEATKPSPAITPAPDEKP